MGSHSIAHRALISRSFSTLVLRFVSRTGNEDGLVCLKIHSRGEPWMVCCWSTLLGPYKHHHNQTWCRAIGKRREACRARLALESVSASSMTTVLRYNGGIGFGARSSGLHDDSSVKIAVACGVVCCWSIRVVPYRHHQVLNMSLGDETHSKKKTCMRTGLALEFASAGSMTTVLGKVVS